MPDDPSSPPRVNEAPTAAAAAAAAAAEPSPSPPNSNDNEDDVSEHCPFCAIATQFQPIDPSDTSADNPEWNPDKLVPPSYVLLATEHVVAFLDIAPLTRGHVLVAPRKHRVKVGDLSSSEMAEIGSLLPLLTRSVIRTTLPDILHSEADYNVVQNNGPGAAQVIPHVHFHIIPRPPFNYQPPPLQPSPSTSTSTPPTLHSHTRNAPPTGLTRSAIQFGRGARSELDDDEAAVLVKMMRAQVAVEWTREFGSTTTTATTGPDENGDGDSSVAVNEAAWIEGGTGLVRNLERRGGGASEASGSGRGRRDRRGTEKL